RRLAPVERGGGRVQHHSFAIARMKIALYSGDGVAAWEAVKGVALWPNFKYLVLTQQVWIEYLAARGAAAVAAARQTGVRDRLEDAADAARKLSKERTNRSGAFAQLIRGALAFPADAGQAVKHLRLAFEGFDAAGMKLHAAAAKYRVGQLLPRDAK